MLLLMAKGKRSLQGQVALVTGAGKGIGKAISLTLASRGVRLLAFGRNEHAIAETVGEIAFGGGEARHVVGDVRDPERVREACARALATWGHLDVVIANAGISGVAPLGQGEEALAASRAILDTNLVGTLNTFDAGLRVMQGPGRLIALSSVLGKFGVPGYGAYCASKAGIQGLVRALAHEVAPKSITCNAICPGWVDTDMANVGIDAMAEAIGTTAAEAKKTALAAFPLGRFLDPDEPAELVAFLCSSEADGITGQALSICGGSTAFGV